MHGSILIFYLVFATAFVLAQCDHFRSKRNAGFTPYMKIGCPSKAEQKRLLREASMNVTCKPHYTHVALQPKPGVVFTPSMVYVPRCAGQCAPGVVCVPRPGSTKTIDIHVTVSKYNRQGQLMNLNQCSVVKVETHTGCGCRCPQHESDCSNKEEYISSRCKCVCKDRLMQKQNCELQMGMLWEDDGCTCKCMLSNMECTTGLTWNAETCQCE